ncbi:hypothetical protein [Sphaerisporangium dianthi]|uniref:Uncharacterized protein n=1 Tax=Sphaerisporangium dianthi TaxID=1436120 RepID=A0ABV9CFQ6_9ACTN
MIEMLFGALALLIGFNLDLDKLIGKVADALGLQSPSVLRTIFLGTVVPGVIFVLTWTAIHVYESIIWPLLPGDHKLSGLWVYALVAHIDGDHISVAGWFRVEQRLDGVSIPEARAYYVESDEGLTFRGDWTSRTVWAGVESVAFLFAMIADGAVREPMPTRYEGHMQLMRHGPHKQGEREFWSGYFHDLGDRRGIHGPVIALRLRDRRSTRSPLDAIDRHLPYLKLRVGELTGERVTRGVAKGRDAE